MSLNGTPFKIDTLIFDMDGILVDVSQSYRQAIIETVDIFLVQVLKLKPGEEIAPLLDPQDIDFLKQAGGFNNDWDVTKAFLSYFLTMLPPQPVLTPPLKYNIPSILAYLEILGNSIHSTIEELRQRKNIHRFARGVNGLGGGINGVKKLLRRHNRHLLPADGSLLKTNIVERIFQEVYLGETLFEETYHTPATLSKRPGLIDQETAIIATDVLEALSQKIDLSIATGRPRAEAEYALQRLNLRHFFQAIVTHDDVVEAQEQGKPDPWCLIEAARRIENAPRNCAYIGDTPDDVLAAHRANQTMPFVAIGSLAVAHDKLALQEHFEANKANIILDHPNQLQKILSHD